MRRRSWVKTSFASLATSLLVTSLLVTDLAHAAPLDAIHAGRIDAAVQAAIAASGAPSASVAVVSDGEIVYARAFGQADLATGLAATPATRYQIASVSKEFTAAAALLLQQDGKLSLDDHVSKWFPDLTSADKITVRQLLSHTSGYSDFWPQDYVMLPMTQPTTPQAVMDHYAKAPLDYQPGEDWQYSNTGYIVAGLIVEKASGQPLFDFIRDRILKPVGIDDAVDISQVDLVAPDALGYERRALAANRLTPEAGKGWLFGSAFLGMTAQDVARWDISLLRRSLLTPESYTTELTTIKLNSGRDSGYAMGFFVSRDNGHTLVEHDGEGAGYISENRIYPDNKLAIVVLTNSMSGQAAFDAADRIGFILMPSQGIDARLQSIFEGLQAGQLDRHDFTDNFNAYLTDQTIADFKTSLGPLGAPATFKLSASRQRGGMEHRTYRLRVGDQDLSLSVYLTPDGRIEQFLVTPR